jgi:hypothetical protein
MREETSMTPRQYPRPAIRFVVAAVAVALFCMTAPCLFAKQGIIKTRDGRTLEGDIAEKSDGVTITLRGIPTSIARENIDSIQYVGNVEEQYKEKLAALPKNPTAKDHLDIARWLFENKAYDLARQECQAALQIDPNNTDAATLSHTIESQLRLERTARLTGGTGTGTGATGAGNTPPRTGTGTTAGPTTAHNASLHKYLSADQINLLKQAEWPQGDNSVKISFAGDVKRKYIASAKMNAAEFNALSPMEQAKEILADGTPEERAGIRILNDPAPLTEFKKTIQPMVLTNCATAGCHGGAGGGRFFLYGTADSDAATYTNFYLLTQTSAKVNGAQRVMFDRTYPDESLLVLYGLPVEISKVSHPEVKSAQWRNLFRSTQDAQYQILLKWINKLVKPDPNYGFAFSLDSAEVPAENNKATSAPAPAPAPAPPPHARPVTR